MVYEGGCHCGSVRIRFATDKALSPRACQCGFCRRHGARNVSDADGEAWIMLGRDPIRYRFGTYVADYLVCAECGIYVGAAATIGERTYASLNLNAFDDSMPDLSATPVDYEGEPAAAKRERRARVWTPLRLEKV